MALPLDQFISEPDIRERFDTVIKAPADLVMEVAKGFDMQSVWLIRTIFRLREMIMGAHGNPRKPQGIVAETRSLGWGTLVEGPKLIVCGARCQPWMESVRFTAIPADEFAKYDEPGQVKIGWTLEAEEIEPAVTKFAHETRAVATDAEAKAKFARYWRWARFGIIAIRLLLLPAIRREAERKYSAARGN
jgi:hypothetical protein